jgi:hypothetical protein
MAPSGVLPRFFASRASATTWAALAAGLGVACCAFAGLYLTVDEGKLRVLLAAIAGPAASAVIFFAMRGTSALDATLRALGMAVILGAACTMIPGMALALGSGGESGFGAFVFIAMFGSVLGAIFGFAYGLPLAALAGLVKHLSRRGSHDGDDRAGRASGVFLACAGGVAALAGPMVLKAEELAATSEVAGVALVALGLAVALVLQIRIVTRSRWVARVRAGLEPCFRVRVADEAEAFDDLPRLVEGAETVVEWHPGSELGAYRTSAEGRPVAIV